MYPRLTAQGRAGHKEGIAMSPGIKWFAIIGGIVIIIDGIYLLISHHVI